MMSTQYIISILDSFEEASTLITSVVRGDEKNRFICPPEYELGRCRKSDPPAVAWIESLNRLVIAHDAELNISRKQLVVRRIRVNEIELINVSKKVTISIGPEKLKPGERARIETPFSIELLDLKIVVKTD